MKNIINIAIIAAVATMLAGRAEAATTITVKGSDTMVILAQKWAEEYMKQNQMSKYRLQVGVQGQVLLHCKTRQRTFAMHRVK